VPTAHGRLGCFLRRIGPRRCNRLAPFSARHNLAASLWLEPKNWMNFGGLTELSLTVTRASKNSERQLRILTSSGLIPHEPRLFWTLCYPPRPNANAIARCCLPYRPTASWEKENKSSKGLTAVAANGVERLAALHPSTASAVARRADDPLLTSRLRC
jgi:hypothetical protein